MTTAWNGRIQNAIDHDNRPFAIAWNDQIVEFDMISIPKGAKNLDLAYKYLAYAAEPEVSAHLGSYIPYGPVRADAASFVPKDVLPKLPTGADDPDKLVEAFADKIPHTHGAPQRAPARPCAFESVRRIAR